MSELKAINAYRLTTNTEDSDVYIHNDEFGCGGDLVECYLKSEADKVIAELKAQVNGLNNRSNLWHYNAVEEHKKFVQADLQITELKEKHKTEVKELLCLIRDKENNFNRAFDSEEKEIRHQKHKRCLLRSVIAEMNATHFKDLFYEAGSEVLADEYNKQITIHYKWRKLWMELAEKFKPNNKSTAQRAKETNHV